MEPKTIFVKPAKGLSIPDPVTQEPLSAEGEDKPDNVFWRRRIQTGDAELAKKPKPAPARPAASNKEA